MKFVILDADSVSHIIDRLDRQKHESLYPPEFRKRFSIDETYQKELEADVHIFFRKELNLMNAYDYQKAAMRTASKYSNLTEAAMGISGEAGEVVDIIKKHIFHEHELDTVALKKELGDLLWYIALTCEVTQIDLDDVMEENIEKLKKRYPDGFDPERSKNRESDDI